MQISTFILMPMIAVAVLWAFNRDYFLGLGLSTFLLVTLPNECFIELAGFLPVLSGQRLVLIIALFRWWQRMHGTWTWGNDVPFARILGWITVTCGISTLIGVEISESLNKFLSLTVESFLFFAMVVTSLRTSEDAVRLLRAVVAGLVLVGVLALVERYGGLDVVKWINFQGGRISLRYEMPGIIFSTYPHPILMGGALALGAALALAMIDAGQPRKFNRLYVAGLPILFAGIYISFSRGPWAAVVVGIIVLYLLGTKLMRRRLNWLLLACVALALVKPGVLTSITNRFGTVLNPNDSMEGSSAQYRIELWYKAFYEISKAGHRFLFGYGDGAHRVMDLSGDAFVSTRHASYAFRSWDSEMACILLQRGIIGLYVLCWLYFGIIRAQFRAYRSAQGRRRDMLAGALACMAAYLFMAFSVKLFSMQFVYVFWSVVGASMVFIREGVPALPDTPPPGEPVKPSSEPVHGTVPA